MRPVVVLLRFIFKSRQNSIPQQTTKPTIETGQQDTHYYKIKKMLNTEYLLLFGSLAIFILVRILFYLIPTKWGILLLFILPLIVVIVWAFVILVPIILFLLISNTIKLNKINKEIKEKQISNPVTIRLIRFGIEFNMLAILVLSVLTFVLVVIKPF